MDSDQWIAQDSGPVTEPVTPEVAPPVAEAVTEPAPTTEAAPAEVQAGAEAAADATKAAGGTDAEAAKAAADYVEALLDNGQPFQIPKGAKIPWEQKGEKGASTVEEMRQNFLRQRDHTQKTMALAEERKRDAADRAEWDRQRVAAEARYQAAEKERQLLFEAQTDPAKREQLERHLEAMASDPEYKRRWERGQMADEYEAVDRYEQEQQSAAEQAAIASDARQYITEQATKFPGVDPADVARLYAEQWHQVARIADPREKAARIDRLRSSGAVDAIFKHEAQRIERVTAPLVGQLSEIQKKLAALEAERRTDQHNTETATAIARSKGAKVAVPAGAAPALPGRPLPQPINAGDPAAREKLKAAWVAGG